MLGAGVSILTVMTMASPASAASVTAGRVNGERVIGISVDTLLVARIAKVVVRANITLIQVANDGLGVTSIANIVHVDAGALLRTR